MRAAGPKASAIRARRFVVGGEALKGSVADFWRRHAPNLQIVNEYGPTETVVGCCVYTLPETDDIQGNVPIGCPTANTHLYVLDHLLVPLPGHSRRTLHWRISATVGYLTALG